MNQIFKTLKLKSIRYIRETKGFTFTSILVSLMIATALLPIIVNCLKLLSNMEMNKMALQNEIGLIQLRRDLLLAYDPYIEGDKLKFTYQDEECSLVFANGHIYRTPGTLIYLEGIENVTFEMAGNEIFVMYEIDEKEYKRIVYAN